MSNKHTQYWLLAAGTKLPSGPHLKKVMAGSRATLGTYS